MPNDFESDCEYKPMVINVPKGSYIRWTSKGNKGNNETYETDLLQIVYFLPTIQYIDMNNDIGDLLDMTPAIRLFITLHSIFTEKEVDDAFYPDGTSMSNTRQVK